MSKLTAILLGLLLYHAAKAQNVFSPSDLLINYDSTAPAGSAANPTVPPEFTMSKWVRTPRVAFNTSNFKSYSWRGMSFRLRFPNNYNPANAAKYPVIVFFHGGGEIGNIHDNEYHLLLGAELFEQRINNNEWNGFLLFPQQTAIGWDDSYFTRINGVLDTLQKYNNADADRVIAMGLSIGGYGAVAYGSLYPGRVASILVASPSQVRTLSGSINNYKHIPLWMANGGVDANPDPANAQAFYKDFRNAGGNIYQTYYANLAHETWYQMWNQADAVNHTILTDYWNNAHKAQPVLFYQQNQFCSGSSVAARMGISAGYASYEWQKDGSTIMGAVANEYVATSAGQYRVRFRRTTTGAWSDWTPHPVVIATKSCSADTVFAEHFNTDNFFVAAASYSIGNFACQGGIVTSGTDQITQDATGVQGNRFLANFTNAAGGGCSFNMNDRVWNTFQPVAVTPNTTYEFSFYLGNLYGNNPAKLLPTINGVAMADSAATTTGSGNGSWKKFTYTWNSGTATTADLGIISRLNETTGNDFAIDEISFKRFNAAPVPACIINTQPVNGATLSSENTAVLSWPAAPTAISYDVFIFSGDSTPVTPKASTTATSYTATGLTAGTTYKWFIAPRNAFGTAGNCKSSATSFTTASLPVPPCVTNIAPANTATVTGRTTATLNWATANTATSYDVYIYEGATVPANPGANTTTNTYTANGLLPGTTYKWFIIPRNAAGAAGNCALTNTTSFTTTGNQSADSCVLNTSPVNGTTITANTAVKLIWRAVPNAVAYDVYVWAAAGAVPTAPVYTTNYAFYDVSALLPGTRYNWFIRPKNDRGEPTGCHGIITSFTTAPVVVPVDTSGTNPGTNPPPGSGTGTGTNPGTGTGTGVGTGDHKGDDDKDDDDDDQGKNKDHGKDKDHGNGQGKDKDDNSGKGNNNGDNGNGHDKNKNDDNGQGNNNENGTADGQGLRGDYYNNPNLAGYYTFTRTDTSVNFEWGSSGPSALINPKTFSVRWTGRVLPTHTGKYSFYTQSDEGARLWVNGQLLIDNWKKAEREASGNIQLTAGVKYTIVMEFYEKKGNAVAKLLWSSASVPKAVIPSRQLFLPLITIDKNKPAGKLRQAAAGLKAAEEIVKGQVNQLRAYPNPLSTGQNITLQFTASQSGFVTVQLLSGGANIVYQQKIMVIKGLNTSTLQTAGLRPGIYVIRVTDAAGKSVMQQLVIS